ncbi:hydrogenase, partial [archaeon]|nr:hydrogenase [archaeon]
MEKTTLEKNHSRGMIRLGAVLVLMGLFSGLLVPHLANPRMGLSSHMEGVMSGLLLMVIGTVWPKLRLGGAARKAACFSLIYGAFTNWANTLLAA